MENCIVFGGLGFVGSNLVKKLRSKYNIYIFSNRKFNNKSKNSFYYNYVNFRKKIKKINPKVIFFLSGNSYPNNSLNLNLYDIERSNIIIQDFLYALAQIKFKGTVIYTSSIAVYGNDKLNKNKYVSENSNLNPKNFYGLSKLLAEEQFKYFHKNYGIKVYILRLSSVFGLNLNKQVIFDLIQGLKSKNKKILVLNGKKTDSRQFIFINDLVNILMKLSELKKNYLLLNISNGKKYKIVDIAKELMKILKVNKKIIFLNKLSPEFPILKNNLLKKNLNNKIRFSNFYTALKDTVNYWK